MLKRRRTAPQFPFEIDIQRSRRKTAVIYVRKGRAEVRVPNRTPNYWVYDFVAERSDWIVERLQEEQRRRQEAYRLEENNEISFLGRTLTVRSLPAGERIVRLGETELWLPQQDLFTDNKRLFHDWLKQEADAYLTPLAWELAEQASVRDRLTELRYKKTKSRWGQCTREGVVQFNWLIMLAPPEAVHYLVAHEICHLQHMNHSRQFWALVDSICPQRKAAQRWLRQNEHKILALH